MKIHMKWNDTIEEMHTEMIEIDTKCSKMCQRGLLNIVVLL